MKLLNNLEEEKIKLDFHKSTHINYIFEEIKEKFIEKNLKHRFDRITDFITTDEELQDIRDQNRETNKTIENINLVFSRVKNAEYAGRAYLDFNLIEYETYSQYRYVALIIHEITHLLLYKLSNKKMTGHCLEFAIMNYCLLNNYDPDNKYNSCFFRSYDIHEDKAYNSISINSARFDDFIRNIKFISINDLYYTACKLAEKIRAKAISNLI